MPALAAILASRCPPAFAQRRAAWAILPDTAPLSSQYPAQGNWWGVIGPRAVLEAWNGWAWDQEGETAWLFGCGGHTDYGGNEVYRWRPTEGFVRLNDPDRLDAAVYEGEGKPVDDGNPAARAPSVHTYAAQVFVDGIVHRFGGAVAWSGNFLNDQWMLDTLTLEHSAGNALGVGYTQVPAAVWDGAARRVIVRFGPHVGHSVDPATGTVEKFELPNWSADGVYAIDEERRLLVHLARTSETWTLHIHELSNDGRPIKPRTVPLGQAGGFGQTIAYDPVGRRVVVWLSEFYAFDGSTISEIEVANAVPSVDPTWGRGVYNRFSWAPSLQGLVTVIHPDDRAMVLRLG